MLNLTKIMAPSKHKRTIDHLAKTAQLSPETIAQRIRNSFSANYELVDQQKKKGIIKKPQKIVKNTAHSLRAYCNVRLKTLSPLKKQAFQNEMNQLKKVTEISSVSGNYDFMLSINAKDKVDFYAFVSQVIAPHQHIERYHNHFVLVESI